MPESNLQFAFLFDRVGRLVRGMQHSGGLNPAQWEALRYLAHANRFSRRPGALAEFLGSTRGTVSQTLIALERKGLIERKPDPSDARGTNVELTHEGHALIAKDPLQAFEDVARELGDQDRQSLHVGLLGLLRSLQRRDKSRAFGVCRSCRHLEENPDAKSAASLLCALTGETLSADETDQIGRDFEAGVDCAPLIPSTSSG